MRVSPIAVDDHAWPGFRRPVRRLHTDLKGTGKRRPALPASERHDDDPGRYGNER